MNYNYQNERPALFTESGVEVLMRVRDNTQRVLKVAGAFQAHKAWDGCTGSNWTMMAALDYLVETKELRRVTEKGSTWGQYEVFIGKDDR